MEDKRSFRWNALTTWGRLLYCLLSGRPVFHGLDPFADESRLQQRFKWKNWRVVFFYIFWSDIPSFIPCIAEVFFFFFFGFAWSRVRSSRSGR